MLENRARTIAHYQSMRSDLVAAIHGLSEDQLSEPTLDGWSVKDHLVHIALWDEIRASEVHRISAGHESLWRMGHEHEAAFEKIHYDLRRAASPSQAKWELQDSHEKLLAALAGASERGLDASLYGEAGLPSDHEAAHVSWIKRWRGERGY
jgi:uncharacterized damage-inducible protein DinB